MDKAKCYVEKQTGKLLGNFWFASPNNPEGAGKGRVGTIYYFKSDSNKGNQIRYYKQDYNIQAPPIPDDIEESK